MPSKNGKGPHTGDENGKYPIRPGKCNCKNRKGEPCGHPAGYRTDHPGEGPCYKHGGVVGKQLKHGRYAKIQRPRLRELVEQYESDPDPMNVLAELALARAMFTDYVERTEPKEGEDGKVLPPQTEFDVNAARKLVSEITMIVKRIEDSRAQNAISRAAFYRVMTEMGRAVDMYVTDERIREKIHDAWVGIRLA